MSLEAVGAYLRVLRENQKISRGEVAKALDTSVSQIQRIENGQSDSRGSVWAFLVEMFGGDPVQFHTLMLNEQATSADGQKAAELWISTQQAIEEKAATQDELDKKAHAYSILSSLDPDDLVDVLIRLQTEQRAAKKTHPRFLIWRSRLGSRSGKRSQSPDTGS